MKTQAGLAAMQAKAATENNLKANAYNLAQGRADYATQPCAEPSMRERLEARRHRAMTEVRTHHMLDELMDLLDKHPDVARILELYEKVGRMGI